jgi:hypothetical protein
LRKENESIFEAYWAFKKYIELISHQYRVQSKGVTFHITCNTKQAKSIRLMTGEKDRVDCSNCFIT